MPAITWTPAMSVGVEALDADHKILIDLINQLDEAMEADDAFEVIHTIIGGLVDYTEYHFKREEGMMRACAYPGLGKHRLEHRAIERRIEGLRRSFDDNIIGGADRRLMAFMRDWLSGHILQRDMAYAPFMGRKPRAAKRRAPAKRSKTANRARARKRPAGKPSTKRGARARTKAARRR